MPADLLLALVGYASAMSLTPGPNNVMLLASGANFGFRRTVPHLAGITCGVVIMLLLVGLGVGQILVANPRLYLTLKVVGLVYLLWLAWKIANSGPVGAAANAERGTPMTFLQGALFQWVNPKAWVMAITATTTFTVSENYLQSLSMMALVFGAVNVPCVGVWAGFGVAVRGLLQEPTRLRAFNVTMALLLVASIVPGVIALFRD
jgi:threonine/homoserine/homoserine lactone efflux protein